LIQEGAKLVGDYYDILEELNLTFAVQQGTLPETIPTTETESLIMEHLSSEPTHIDEVGRQCGLPIATVSSTLAVMELKGMVRQVGGMNYTLAREARAQYRVRVE
jgi:DNA processing protein